MTREEFKVYIRYVYKQVDRPKSFSTIDNSRGPYIDIGGLRMNWLSGTNEPVASCPEPPAFTGEDAIPFFEEQLGHRYSQDPEYLFYLLKHS